MQVLDTEPKKCKYQRAMIIMGRKLTAVNKDYNWANNKDF